MAATKIADNLEISKKNMICCSRCGHVFSSISENWKIYAVRRKAEEGKSALKLVKLHYELGVFEYYCPTCAVLLDVELSSKDEPPLWSIQLK